jgi:hypothetical protein
MNYGYTLGPIRVPILIFFALASFGASFLTGCGVTAAPISAASSTGQIPSTPTPSVSATPNFSPAPGTYNATQTVTISDSTVGAAIYYTTDGTAPTSGSMQYTSALTVSSTETINAIAIASGYANSPVAKAAYTINAAAGSTNPQTPSATPAFSPAPGTYNAAQSITISDATAGAAIYYTTDGSTPTAGSTQYTSAIQVSSTETVNAIAIASGYANSPVSSAAYTINAAGSGGSGNPQTKVITIADAVPGVTIYYTTDGTTPTTSSARYTGPITIDSTATVKAMAVAAGYTNSAVGSITVTDPSSPQAATPTLLPAAGAYSTAQTVSISDTTAGATIYYTTDGSTPTTNSAQYTSAITVSSTQTINAIAVASGYANSATASATYNIGSGSGSH